MGELVPAIAISLTSVVAGSTDLARRRVYNWLTFPVVAAGLAYSFYIGVEAGLSSLGAVGLALLLYGSLFFLRAIGAGDVKLLMALSAWGGVEFCLELAALSILVGAVFGVGQLVYKGELMNFARKIYVFVATLINKHMKTIPPQVNQKIKFPFAFAMALSSLFLVARDSGLIGGLW